MSQWNINNVHLLPQKTTLKRSRVAEGFFKKTFRKIKNSNFFCFYDLASNAIQTTSLRMTLLNATALLVVGRDAHSNVCIFNIFFFFLKKN